MILAARVCPLLLLVSSLVPLLPAQAKRPLAYKDFDAWRSILSPTLSRDGKYVAYGSIPQDGDGELIVRAMSTGKDSRYPVGALPQPTPRGEGEEGPPPARTFGVVFTADGSFVLAQTHPTKAELQQARSEKRKPEDMPKPGLLIVNTRTGESSRVADVKSFQVPEKGPSWVAYHKGGSPAAASSAGPTAEDDEADQRARGVAATSGPRPAFGTGVVLQDLTKPGDAGRTLPNVVEYSFAKDGRSLVYLVGSRKAEENGAYVVTPGSTDAPLVLASGSGRYGKLAWDRQQQQLAFFKSDAVYLWRRGGEAATLVAQAALPGLPEGFKLSESGGLSFSRDGKQLVLPAGKVAVTARAAAVDEQDAVRMDLWHWRDEVIQPMQRVRATRDRSRTFQGVWDLAGARYTQLATPDMPSIRMSDDGRIALGFEDRPYRGRVDYDGRYADVYALNAATGERRLLAKQVRAEGQNEPVFLAPDGLHAFAYTGLQWRLLRVGDGSQQDVTSGLGVRFSDELDDVPAPDPSYGQAGWSADSKSFFVYDRYDLWQLFVDGRKPRCVTGGEGHKQKIVLRVARLRSATDAEDERAIDLTQPLMLRGESEVTRDSGFFRLKPGGGPLQRVLWSPRNYRVAAMAKDADVLLLTASRFDEFPDLLATDASLKAPKKISNLGAQMEPFHWGTSELMHFRNTDGQPLSGALFKPANFDPKRKYPLLVYIYERLSQTVHNFVEPKPHHSINVSWYVSNGYVVLLPDIVYTLGNPGQSALKCVLPAVQEVVDQGYIDEARIGIQGHSWGGYQIAYMITQTTRFRAAEAGAPVGNMTSAYSGIRWGSGLPRQFQYEQTQSRIGATLYDEPHKFLENSPIFHVKRVQTPLLILHDDNDDAVPWYQGIELFLALRRTGKEAYLLNYNGEYHGLRRRANQRDYSIRMKQYFDHFLMGAPKPEWMEKGVPYLDREAEKERLQRSLEGGN
ncbi:MAG: S9 family peptidase [Bryobacterales bacterium]|nr:S9 family peptidase [Bryobacterales bacterium]